MNHEAQDAASTASTAPPLTLSPPGPAHQHQSPDTPPGTAHQSFDAPPAYENPPPYPGDTFSQRGNNEIMTYEAPSSSQ